MKVICLIILLFASTLLPQTASAAYAWYYGKVERLFLNTDGFVLTFDTTSLDDCQYKYVYYKISTLGDGQVNRAYSMALAAQASDRTLGVIVDKAINGVGGLCFSNGGMDIKD